MGFFRVRAFTRCRRWAGRRSPRGALDTAIGKWLAERERAAGQADRPRPSLAVDGKTVRGARRSDATQVHLLAAMTATGMVTAQREVDGKTNEITVFQPLLAPLDLHGTVVTFDALHSQAAHARFLVEDNHAPHIALIKGNQPTLLARAHGGRELAELREAVLALEDVDDDPEADADIETPYADTLYAYGEQAKAVLHNLLRHAVEHHYPQAG